MIQQPGARPPSAGRRIGLWLVAMAAGVLLVAHTRFSTDLSAFLPADPDPTERLLIEQLEDGEASRTILLGVEGGDAAARAEAARTLARTLRSSGAFEQVQDGERDDWRTTGEWLVAHRYALSPAMTPAHFEVAGLRDALLDTFSSPFALGATAPALLLRDPTGETARIAESLVPAHAPRIDHGVWVSRTAPRAVLVATTRAAGADLDGQAAALAEVRAAFASAAAQGLRLRESGAPVFAMASRARIEREAARLGGLGLVTVGLLLLVTFASRRALLAAFLPVGTGFVAGVCAVAIVFGSVHGLTLAFGSTLIGEAVDYAIYFLLQARDGGWRRWLRESWPTVRLGVATSVCGFAVLIASGFPGLAQLGVFSVAGLIAAALATRLLLPALMPDGASGERCWQRLSRVAAGAPRVLPRWRLAFGLAGVAGLLIVAAAHGRLWNADLASLSPVTPGEQALDAALRADLGANDARTLVVAGGPDREAALRAAEAAGPALDALVVDGVLAGYDSPARLLPSAAEQARRRHAIPDAATLRARLAEAAANTPWQAARLEPFIAEAELARDAPPITAGTLDGTALKPVLDGLLVPRRGGGWAALMPLQAPGGAGVDAHAVRQGLARAHAPGAQVVDLKASLDELYLRYLADARRLALLGGAAVVGLVAWRLRSARRVGAVIVPLALAVAIVLGGFAAAGAALGILHLVGLLLIVAIGSNYGLFFDRWGAAGPPDLHAPASLLLANMTTVIAFGLLALSSLPVLSALGRVVAPGVLLALAASAAFGRQADRA